MVSLSAITSALSSESSIVSTAILENPLPKDSPRASEHLMLGPRGGAGIGRGCARASARLGSSRVHTMPAFSRRSRPAPLSLPQTGQRSSRRSLERMAITPTMCTSTSVSRSPRALACSRARPRALSNWRLTSPLASSLLLCSASPADGISDFFRDSRSAHGPMGCRR